MPVARLARLAVDHRYQKRDLGERLLADALSRCFRLSEEIGLIGVVVDAKHEQARRYDERFEFERFPDAPLTWWLPTAAIARL
ncbi:GNAT family N-acetyltransferase [Methylocaldum sp. 14B]|uniref:GNAT family N-acetyltransferase n=1 Tax=Methylocaldum sp. 14B TaxID=1912213 RepID=UPI000989A979|nr:GNAT family N-acetyltransferase [Methylocaldum sp. 14B]